MLNPLNRKRIDTPARPVRVLQFGEGNFLRAFADWIIDILNEQTDFNGAIQIVQPLPQGMARQLNSQDGLYHVLLHGIQNGNPVREKRLITSVAGAVNPYDDFAAYLETAKNPDTRFIISNTTESGIAFSASDALPDEIASTFPGKLTQWLYQRFVFFKGSIDHGMVLLPCELIEKNGSILRETVLQYSKHWNFGEPFDKWINSACIFCTTLVDRIVPGYPREDAAELKTELGFDDNMMVKAEPFHLWVIEGPKEISALLPVHKTNLHVKLTTDVTPYRTRKVRILNGAHTSIVPIAYLKGLRTVQETVDNPETNAILRKIIFEEIIPTLDLPEEELRTFATDVLERFQNPFIRHELISIALNSVSKFKVRVLPSLLTYYQRKGQLPPTLVKSLAMLILFYKGEFNGENIPLNDAQEVLDFFQKAWQMPLNKMSSMVLSNTTLWDKNLLEIAGLHEAITIELGAILSTPVLE
jgi:tagaturonate reductase